MLLNRVLLCLILISQLPVFAEEDEEAPDLREQLTEREDENRVEEPYELEILGNTLQLLGAYEVAVDAIDRLSLGEEPNQHGQTLLEMELDVEAFYSVGSSLSFFAQAKLALEEDLDSKTEEAVSDIFVERGEMWIFLEEPFGLPLMLDVGRLDFEDDRLWWWDQDLDALRLEFEAETWDIAVAAAREMFSARSDQSFIEPELEDVTRIITEISWDWHQNHAIQLFNLLHDDSSRTEQAEDIIVREREDEFDGELAWFGIRAAGAVEQDDGALVGYWIDAGFVDGDEKRIETEDISDREAEVEEVLEREVQGWAVDLGITTRLPGPRAPRLTLAYARASGDKDEDDRKDRAYAQTGLHGNEPGFGGMQRFQGYGELLDPELSNLSIITLGFGLSLLENTTLDLVYHDYRLVERAEDLRDARIDTELSGESRDLGQGIDLILAIEQWDDFEIELSGAAFHGGKAFDAQHGRWVFGGFAAARYAF